MAGGSGRAGKIRLSAVALPLAALLASPAGAAAAAATNISTASGTVAEVAFAIGRQTGVSISFQGGMLSASRVPAIRGRMSPEAALRRLAKAGGLHLRAVGPRAFILSPRPALRPRPVLAARPTPPKPSVVPAAALAPEEVPQEVVVTASKRDTLARRFAGQWHRIDGRDLSLTGVVGTDAISTRSVGFSSTHLGAGRNKLFIRGIADSSFSGPTQSPVGQYLGDLRTGYSGPDPDLRLVDMDSVEVLEGPQGTLYGAGALGGIILLKPNMPDSRRTGGRASSGVSLTQHGAPGFDLAATLNTPLGGEAGLRVTGYHANEGGYVDNRLTGEKDVNRLRVSGGRVIGTTNLMPDWSADLIGAGQWIRGEDSQYADDRGDGLSRSSAIPQPFASDFQMASLVIRKDRGDLRFRSTHGATFQEVTERFDVSLPQEKRRLEQRSKARSFSSETRLWRPMRGGFSWLAGLSLLDHRYEVGRSLDEAAGTRKLGGTENRVRELTLYGEAGVELAPGVEASAGGRFTVADIRGAGQHLSMVALDRVALVDPNRTERRFLPSASLLVRPVDGLSFYARYQQGFRPGGLSIANDSVRFYQRDLLGTAEAGFRLGKPRSDRLDLAGSLSWSRWKHIQADYLDETGLPVTDNIGDGRVWSATLNGGLRLSPELRLEAGAAWNEGKVTNPSAALTGLYASADMSGAEMRIPNIAKVVGRASLEYKRDLGGERAIEASLYGRYVGTSRLGIGPKLGQRQGDYFDSGIVTRLIEGERAWSLSVTNLADQVGNRFAFGAPVLSDREQLTPLRPRTLRLGLDWAF